MSKTKKPTQGISDLLALHAAMVLADAARTAASDAEREARAAYDEAHKRAHEADMAYASASRGFLLALEAFELPAPSQGGKSAIIEAAAKKTKTNIIKLRKKSKSR
jgi:hypothetical protein